ncbi:MAG: proline--tRNA ligase, partial [Pseudomonadota bacterium]
MRISQSLIPITKEKPIGSTVISHQLMEQAGMIAKLSSGLYHWLPLGMRVLNKAKNIIKAALDNHGCQELLNPIIQPAEIWQQSGRYDDYGAEMLRLSDRHEHELLFSPTNEEAMTDIMRRYIKSYKQLPQIIYQMQWKFRDEIRPRFGVMRAREFLMKDAYSFDIDPDSAKQTYYHMFTCYLNIFKRLGLSVIPLKAETGPIGGDLSHEFHVITNNGESGVFYQPELL